VDNPYPLTAGEYDDLFEAAATALIDEGFTIDRRDYRFGQILSDPLVAATMFEPWYGGKATPGQAVASTLNYQRRVARITLAPTAEDADAYTLSVVVNIEQIELPARRLSGSTRGGRIFDELQSTPAELEARGIRGNYWSVIGRDEKMEQRLLRAITGADAGTTGTQPVALR
jgi:hypothetical protein